MAELSDLINSGKDYFLDKPINKVSEFYLSGTITSPEDYIDWFNHIRNAGPNDIIYLRINCFGGDLYTAVQFIRVLQETQAHVVASVEGACMSAATMIFLQASEFEISGHSSFMFHNYSGGSFGKGGEMIDQLTYERAWSEDLLKNVYADFLTVKEINSILDGKDVWMDDIEVTKRLESKAKKIQKQIKKKS